MMMPPNNRPPMGPEMGPPNVPVGPGPAASGPGGGNPDAIKQQLIQLLNQAKKVAQDNGVDFNEILSAVSGNKVRSDAPVPRPPMP